MNSSIAITFEQAWNYGGPLMWVLAALSVFALTTLFYVWYSQRKGVFIPDAIKRVQAAKDPVAEGTRLATRVYQSVDWLADIAAIAPLVGLLGTVLGMFQAFGGVASETVAAGSKELVLVRGISQAIVTTIFGLAIAIPCMVMHAYMRRRATRLIAAFEEKADELYA